MLTFITPIAPNHLSKFNTCRDSIAIQSAAVKHLWLVDAERKGPAAIRNRLLAQVDTPYVAFLDADDWIERDYAHECLAAIRPGRYVYTAWYQEQHIIPAPPPSGWCRGQFHLITAVLETDIARAVGGFDESLPGMEDTDFWLKILRLGICGIPIQKPLVHYAAGGGRGQGLRDQKILATLKRTIDERYGGYIMGCCGGEVVISREPIGDKQSPNDVQAMAMWRGNHPTYGKATGRRYPRMSYPKVTWVHPADVRAAPQEWQMLRQLDTESAPGQPSGVEALTGGLLNAGLIMPPPPTPRSVAPPVPLTARPNFARIRQLLGRPGYDGPVFVRPVANYPSYADFWHLVHLSGFRYIDRHEEDLDNPAHTYIYVGPEGIPDCSRARARTIFWQLEYAGDYIDQINYRTAREVWASDPAWAVENGAQYVILGSHPMLRQFSSASDDPFYDVTMLAYMTSRRQHIKDALADLEWTPDYPGHGSEQRDRALSRTKLMLIVHQHETAYLSPLRLALAAAYELPIVCETVRDPGPYRGHVLFADYDCLPEMVRLYLNGKIGDVNEVLHLHNLLCIQHPFRKCVEQVLEGTPEYVAY